MTMNEYGIALDNPRCLILTRGKRASANADRLEEFAVNHRMQVVETLINDEKAFEKIQYYLEHDCVSSILIRSVWDVSKDKDILYGILKLAADHGISINEEERDWQAATIIWDGGDGC